MIQKRLLKTIHLLWTHKAQLFTQIHVLNQHTNDKNPIYSEIMFLSGTGRFRTKYWGGKNKPSLGPPWLMLPRYKSEVLGMQQTLQENC